MRRPGLLALLLVPLGALADGKPPLTLGICQLYGPEHARGVGPLVEPYLAGALGGPVTVKVFAEPDELAAALARKQVDLAWIPPLAFVHASQKDPEVLALSKAMRNGALTYRSVLFVRADAAAKKVKDLKGAKVAYVTRSSTSGYLYPRELVKKETGQPAERFFGAESFEGDHPSVCQAVKSGAAQVGATYGAEASDPLLVRADGCGAEAGEFRVLASTGNVPNEVIAARSDFPPMRLNEVVAAFGRMGLSEPGKKVLAEAFKVDGWGVAVDGDFAPILDLVSLKHVKAKVAPPEGAAPPPPKKRGAKKK
jgi:phosphonate transport system substrate-binding protein